MDVTVFERDDKGNRVAIAGDITITIGCRGDNIMIEQDGDHDEPDIIMMYDPEQIQAVIDRLQYFLKTL